MSLIIPRHLLTWIDESRGTKSRQAFILQALSVTGLSVLGVINVYFAFKLVIGMAILFGLLGLVGRLISQPVLVKDPAVENTDV